MPEAKIHGDFIVKETKRKQWSRQGKIFFILKSFKSTFKLALSELSNFYASVRFTSDNGSFGRIISEEEIKNLANECEEHKFSNSTDLSVSKSRPKRNDDVICCSAVVLQNSQPLLQQGVDLYIVNWLKFENIVSLTHWCRRDQKCAFFGLSLMI